MVKNFEALFLSEKSQCRPFQPRGRPKRNVTSFVQTSVLKIVKGDRLMDFMYHKGSLTQQHYSLLKSYDRITNQARQSMGLVTHTLKSSLLTCIRGRSTRVVACDAMLERNWMAAQNEISHKVLTCIEGKRKLSALIDNFYSISSALKYTYSITTQQKACEVLESILEKYFCNE